MILRGRQRDDGSTVGNRQHAHFVAVEPLFDDQLISRRAEFFILGNPVHSLDRHLSMRANKHSFSGRQAIGLHHHRHIFSIAQVRSRSIQIAEHLKIGRGNIGLAEQVLAEHFAPFQLGRSFAGSEDAQLFRLKSIDDASHQRRFRPDHRQADVVFFGKANEPRKIGGRKIDILRIDRRAGIPRRDKYARAAGFASASTPMRARGLRCRRSECSSCAHHLAVPSPATKPIHHCIVAAAPICSKLSGKLRLVVRISAVDTPRQIRGHWRNRPEPNRLNFCAWR